MEDSCSLRICQSSINVKALSAVRKATKLSLSEIRDRVSSGEPIVEYGDVDCNGWATLLILSKELLSLGVETQTYLDDEPTPLSYFVNSLAAEKEDILNEGNESLYEDEPWWGLDLSEYEE